MQKFKWWAIGIVAASPWFLLTLETLLHSLRVPHWHP